MLDIPRYGVDVADFFRLALLYAHLIAFALTLSAIVWADWRILSHGPTSPEFSALKATTQVVVPGTLALLLTGLGIMAIDTGLQWHEIMSRPKLLAKLCVVFALLANGLALHTLAFPALERKSECPRLWACLLCLSGSVSAVSWLYAGFLGIARPLVGRMDWADFMTLYGVLITGGFGLSLILIGPKLVKFLSPEPLETETSTWPYRHSTL
jgi:hypothetical protein